MAAVAEPPYEYPSAGRRAAGLENDAVVTTAVKEELSRFLADIERRALRIAEIATGSRDDALDIVQDAMLQLARHYAHRPAGEWLPLFHRILDNKILDWQRRQTVRRRLFGTATDTNQGDEDPLELIPDLSQPDGAQQLKRAQAMAVLERALRNLPKRQRQAFVLRIWEGLSVEETAAVMGCGDGSVKTHLSRALHALREQLQTVWP
jgi:RNA polymerase sigma-70 factor (ECF subfamily)